MNSFYLIVLFFGFFTIQIQETDSSALEIIQLFDENNNDQLSRHEYEDYFIEMFEGGGGGGGHSHSHSHSSEFEVKSSQEGVDCPLPRPLFDQYDLDGNRNLNETEVTEISLRMIILFLGGCRVIFSEDQCGGLSEAEAWLAAIGTAFLISLLSLVAIMLFPLFKRELLEGIILPSLIAFAVGALVGDAVLHLIPAAIGAHGHDAETEEEEDEKAYLGPTFMALVGVLAFFVVELFFAKFHNHDHFNDPLIKEEDAKPPKESTENDQKEQSTESEEKTNSSNTEESKNRKTRVTEFIKSKRSYGWISLIADGLHNLTDGLALGAAWATGWPAGIATTIAIFFHELAQEFGDYALLISAGFSRYQALLFNFLCALTCILGAIIGSAAGTNKEANKYILGFIAGGFLYIALADMVPHLAKEKRRSLQGAYVMAMLIGFLIMLFIALWLEELNFCPE